MTFDENTTKIILAIVGIVTIALGGSWIAIRKSKKRTNTVSQKNITITGKGKVVGGDDNSIN